MGNHEGIGGRPHATRFRVPFRRPTELHWRKTASPAASHSAPVGHFVEEVSGDSDPNRAMLQAILREGARMFAPMLGYAAGTLIVVVFIVLAVGLLAYFVYQFFIRKGGPDSNI